MLLDNTPDREPTRNNGRHAAKANAKPGAAENAIAMFDANVARARRVGVFTTRITLTRALAKHIIANCMPAGSNRRLRRGKVAILADAIRRGRWDGNTHQGLAISIDGVVNDGQHRINAVAEAGVPIEVLVTFGQPRSTFEVIDQDLTPRTASDLLEMDALKVGTAPTAAAIARVVVVLDRVAAGMSFADAIRLCSKQDVLTFARDNEDALRACVYGGRNAAGGMKAKVSPANIGAALFLILRAKPDGAHFSAFVDGLRSGASLAENNPILVCREGLRAGTFGNAIRKSDDRRVHEVAAVIKAWNAWRKGRTARGSRVLSVSGYRDFPQVTA